MGNIIKNYYDNSQSNDIEVNTSVSIDKILELREQAIRKHIEYDAGGMKVVEEQVSNSKFDHPNSPEDGASKIVEAIDRQTRIVEQAAEALQAVASKPPQTTHYYAEGANHNDRHREMNINISGSVSDEQLLKIAKGFFADDEGDDVLATLNSQEAGNGAVHLKGDSDNNMTDEREMSHSVQKSHCPFVTIAALEDAVISKILSYLQGKSPSQAKDVMKPLRAAQDAGVIRRITFDEMKAAFPDYCPNNKSSVSKYTNEGEVPYIDEAFKTMVEDFKSLPNYRWVL